MLCCHYTPDGRFVLSGSEDTNIRVWKVPQSALMLWIPLRIGNVASRIFKNLRCIALTSPKAKADQKLGVATPRETRAAALLTCFFHHFMKFWLRGFTTAPAAPTAPATGLSRSSEEKVSADARNRADPAIPAAQLMGFRDSSLFQSDQKTMHSLHVTAHARDGFQSVIS